MPIRAETVNPFEMRIELWYGNALFILDPEKAQNWSWTFLNSLTKKEFNNF